MAPISGARRNDLEQDLRREQISKYLPYIFYDPDNHVYSTLDDKYGYIWEVTPLPFAGSATLDALKGLMATNFPIGVCVQYHLFADPYVGGILSEFLHLKTRDDDLIVDNAASLCAHLNGSAEARAQMNGIAIRNFRCFISIKSPEPLEEDLTSTFVEGLAQFGCRPLPPGGDDGLVSLLRRLFTKLDEARPGSFSDARPISAQVVDAGNETLFSKKTVHLGDQVARCLTPQTCPKEVTPLRMNRVLGRLMGVRDDADQLSYPFLYTLNVFYEDYKSALAAKTQVVLAQKGTGTLAAKIARANEEMLWANDTAENERFVFVVPILWVFGQNEDEARDAVSRAKKLFEREGFALQEESYLSRVLLIAALPLGTYFNPKSLVMLQRDFQYPVSTAAQFIPMQADFRGAGKPVQLFVGRKGQLMGFDLFGPHMNNHNFVVAAATGAGKSFLLNSLLFQNYAAGAKVRIIDVGYSYQKNCALLNGRFIDVGHDAEQVVLNPFDMSVAKDREDFALDVEMAASVLQLMATSASKTKLNEAEINLLKSAARYVYRSGRQKDGVDAAREYLATYPKHAPDMDKEFTDLLQDPARQLAFNLTSFSSGGEFGAYFNGPSNIDISGDDFVVLELDRLSRYPQLLAVIGMQVINLITQDLYLSDRGSERFILFEEAASLLDGSIAGDNAPLFASVIEAGFRRARKYRGSIGVVLQSVLDIERFGDVGAVIWENAATKMFLEGSAYEKAAELKIIPYEGFALELLKSVKNNKPRYSEVFIDSPMGMGVVRLIVDPHSYYIYTSEGRDMKRFSELMRAGVSTAKAIDLMARGADEAVLRSAPAPQSLRAAEAPPQTDLQSIKAHANAAG